MLMRVHRGRPPGRLTIRRRQVLQFIERRGGQFTLGEIVRCCGLHDRSAAKRILRDLRHLNLITPPAA